MQKNLVLMLVFLALIGLGTKIYYYFFWEQETEEEYRNRMLETLDECPSRNGKSGYFSRGTRVGKYDGDSIECEKAYEFMDKLLEE